MSAVLGPSSQPMLMNFGTQYEDPVTPTNQG